MTPPRFFAIVLGAASVLAPAGARADVDLLVGGQLQVLPVGQLTATTPFVGGTSDLATAFAVQGAFGARLHPHIAVAFAPRLIAGINDQERFGDPSEQVDLAVRGTAGVSVAPGLDVQVFLAPGYSWLIEDGGGPRGLVVGVGGGGAYQLTPTLSLTAEVGYTFGRQEVGDGDDTFRVSTEFLHLGLGLEARL